MCYQMCFILLPIDENTKYKIEQNEAPREVQMTCFLDRLVAFVCHVQPVADKDSHKS